MPVFTGPCFDGIGQHGLLCAQMTVKSS